MSVGNQLDMVDLPEELGPYRVYLDLSADGRKLWIHVHASGVNRTVLRVYGLAMLSIDGLQAVGVPPKLTHDVSGQPASTRP